MFIPFLLCFLNLYSQQTDYRKGVITDTIWVDDQKRESFGFYAPDSYDPTLPSPVIFIFEPLARGKTGIEPFISASDTYGYLLICSNDSRNGPQDRNRAIAQRLLLKVANDLNIDPKRMYTSGFSGGARLATLLASTGNPIQGVVSCGAGLNLDSGGLPIEPNYSYAVIMGNEDMNFYELGFTEKYLRKIKLPHEIFTFDMNHRWPGQDQILLAFDWLELEAYKNRLVPADSATVNRIYKKFYEQAKSKEKNDRLLAAHAEYGRILANLSRYFNLDSIANLSSELTHSSRYQNQLKKNTALLEKEKNLTYEFLNRFGADLQKNNFQMSWWDKHIEKIKKNQNAKHWMERKMYNRVLYRIYANAMESVSLGSEVRTPDQKRYCYDICILVYPEYPVPYIRQIELAMGTGQQDLAFDYLEKLLSTGYKPEELEHNYPPVTRLKGDQRYEQLMEKN